MGEEDKEKTEAEKKVYRLYESKWEKTKAKLAVVIIAGFIYIIIACDDRRYLVYG